MLRYINQLAKQLRSNALPPFGDNGNRQLRSLVVDVSIPFLSACQKPPPGCADTH